MLLTNESQPKELLLCCDCFPLLQEIPDNSVDLVLTDPPFAVTQNKWDKPIDLEALWKELHRVAKPNTAFVLHCIQPFTTDLIQSNRKEFKYCWVWNKHYCRGFLNAKKQPLRNTEDIAVFYRKQCLYNPQMRKGEMRSKGNSANQRGCYGSYKPVKTVNDIYYPTTILDFAGVAVPDLIHPTQKPVELEAYLIRTYTEEGGVVLDPFMGSGTTGVACRQEGRIFIGIEQDETYFSAARQRILETEIYNPTLKTKEGEPDVPGKHMSLQQ